MTTDSLQLFLNEAGRYPLADGRRGGGARQADRARRPQGEGPDDQLEPPPRRLDREEVPGPRALAARPDPGGDHRADPRRGEVRLAAWLQVLDVRDVVDPPGGAARRREQVAHDPDPGPHRRARAEDRARRAGADAEARAAHRRTRRSRRRRSSRSSTSARCARRPGRWRASTSRSATRGTPPSATSSPPTRGTSRRRSSSG